MEESLKKDLNNLFSKLKKCKNIFNYDELLAMLSAYEEIIKEQNLDVEIPKVLDYEEIKFQNKLNEFYIKDFKLFIKEFNNMYDMNKEFIDSYKSILDEYAMPVNYYVYKQTLSEEKIINLVKEFYKYYDKDVYNYVNYMFDEKRVFFTNSVIDDANGLFTEGYEDILPYINVEKTNTVSDVFCLGHELMHGYVNSLVKYASDKEKRRMYYNNLGEVYPKFIELVILDYLNMIGYNNRDLDLYKKDYDDSIIEGIQGFDYFLEEDMDIQENQRLFHNIEGYLYAEIMAYNYHEKYLGNKDEVNNNIKNLVIDNKYYDREYLLNNYGLSFDDLKNKKILTKNLYKRI